MARRIHDEEAQINAEPNHPLIDPTPSKKITPLQKAMRKTFKSTAHLAKLLPTGTLLTFQILAPVCTNQGHCYDTNRWMTACLIIGCGLSCFVLNFSDSFRDEDGKVRHGLATFTGLWVIDGTTAPPEVAKSYKIKFIDFVHGFVSVLVFAAVVLFEESVVACFYPIQSEEVKQLLTALPVVIGFVSSGLFVAFPTTRHGIGFPLTR